MASLRALAFGKLPPGQSQAFQGVPATAPGEPIAPAFSPLPGDESAAASDTGLPGDTGAGTDTLALPSREAFARSQAAFAAHQAGAESGGGTTGAVPFGATDDPNNFLNKLAELPGFNATPPQNEAEQSDTLAPPAPPVQTDQQREQAQSRQSLQRLAGSEAPTSDQPNSEALAVLSGIKKAKQGAELSSSASNYLFPDLGTRATGTGSELTAGGSLSDTLRNFATPSASGTGLGAAGVFSPDELGIMQELLSPQSLGAFQGGASLAEPATDLASAFGQGGLEKLLESLGGTSALGWTTGMLLPIITSFFQGDAAFGGDNQSRVPGIVHDTRGDLSALPRVLSQMKSAYVDPRTQSGMTPEELRSLYGNALTAYGSAGRLNEMAQKSGTSSEGVSYPDVSSAVSARDAMLPVNILNMVSSLDRLARLGGTDPYGPGEPGTNYSQGLIYGEALHALSGLAGLPTYGPRNLTALAPWDPNYAGSSGEVYFDPIEGRDMVTPNTGKADYLRQLGADPALADVIDPMAKNPGQGNYLANLVPLFTKLNPDFWSSKLGQLIGRGGLEDLLTASPTTRGGG